jgi:hypothetical protein
VKNVGFARVKLIVDPPDYVITRFGSHNTFKSFDVQLIECPSDFTAF